MGFFGSSCKFANRREFLKLGLAGLVLGNFSCSPSSKANPKYFGRELDHEIGLDVFDRNVASDTVPVYLDWNARYNPNLLLGNSFQTDVHAVLSELGLRGRDSYTYEGNISDTLSLLLVQKSTIQAMNTIACKDGIDGNERLPITLLAPNDPLGQRSRYLELRYADANSIGATAFGSSCSCGSINGIPLGIFVNRVLDIYKAVYRQQVMPTINEGDKESLKSILEGFSAVTLREQNILSVAKNYSLQLAAITMHELGHIFGLEHNEEKLVGAENVMNATIDFSADRFAFCDEQFERLRNIKD